ncbi:hypothetical protein FA95DRAFT_1562778 [Auriscalpium vulgare]|uniref:Uncharacterized protein n=1 Tax=Auriscalpium vulgare TaxID=40419 RepID=A0ACB8RI92_9AGAM|nr:hypothetical protein FA95DRAFT_1562778 [Auriscalpium vulgare]
MDQHPRKKRKRSGSGSDAENIHVGSSVQRRTLLEELDLEIGIREKLQETICSRITWALVLQQSLEKRIHQKSDAPHAAQSANEFQSVAMDALQACEAPCLPLLSREASLLPPRTQLLPAQPKSQVDATEQAAALLRGPQTRRKRTGPLLTPSRPPTKLLFLRNTAISPPAIAKLVCPDCMRLDFPRVQGLLNHCRIYHGRDFGSHDECIRGCAVLVPDEEVGWVLENGTELPAVSLPSLRRLFEIAVGSGGGVGVDLGARAPSSPDAPPAEGAASGGVAPEKLAASTHLSRTLGHHIDSPALAPFLGRAQKRRHIAAHGQDDIVDVESGGAHSAIPGSEPRWRMPYTHRSVARAALDVAGGADPDPERKEQTVPLRSAGGTLVIPSLLDAAGSRFHIRARVSISDRSLWLPIDRRPSSLKEHTHRWMLAVESPSYSLHVSAFLQSMTVTCLTDPPPSTLSKAIVVSAPPFIASATTDRPFLAKVTLTWVGAQNPPIDTEHWVELDLFKSASPVLGDEQVLDIELDRHTELRPVARSAAKETRQVWEQALIEQKEAGRVTSEGPEDSAQDSDTPSYVALLRSLISRFPLTMKDMKRRAPPPLPYRLVTTPAAFHALVPGRRKAIEWGRARALRERYEEVRKAAPPAQGHLPLSTADVFCWLEDEGLFLRPPPPKPAPGTSTAKKLEEPHIAESESLMRTASGNGYCTACGLKSSYHYSYVKQEPVSNSLACPFAPGAPALLPILDVHSLLPEPTNARPSQDPLAAPTPSPLTVADMRFSSRDWCSAVDSDTVRMINQWLGPLRLDRFRYNGIAEHMDAKMDSFGLASSVAPSAVLGLALRALIRRLVSGGLAAMQDDVERARRAVRPPRGGARAAAASTREWKSEDAAVLAPSHLARGVHVAEADGADPAGRAIGLALSVLGSAPRMVRAGGSIAMDTHGRARSPSRILVKLEAE